MRFEITIKETEHSRISNFDSKNVVFGKVFADHMFICDYIENQWQNPRIVPYGKMPFSPSLSALHYGQSIFEGMKVFKNTKGEIAFFRPQENIKRMNKSAERMCMPTIPEELFLEGLHALVNLDKEWIPTDEGSALYLRPFMFATDDFLGVKNSNNYCFMIYGCPVNSYYSHSLKVKVEEHYSRSAAKGGVGSAKCAGNYAAAMYPTKLAKEAGFDQVLWTDSETHTMLEETGTSNVFIITDEAAYTPELTESLLDGITRKSVITLLEDKGIKVIEKHISIDELIQWHEQNKLKEMFVTGTAAVITNIELFNYKGKDYAVNAKNDLLKDYLIAQFNGIRTLSLPDKFQWMESLKQLQEVE